MFFTKLALQAGTGMVVATAAVQAIDSITPWSIAFNADAIVVALHGALGGSARWLFLREPWRHGLRLMLLGAILAAGIGNLWRLLVKTWVGDVPDSILNQPETAYSGAFLVGLLAVTILGRFFDETAEKGKRE